MALFSSIGPSLVLSGFLVGLLVGQTGMGGGSLMAPLLILLFGVHPATAVGTDLLQAAAVKSVGALVHGLSRTVDWQITARLISGSMPATLLTLAVISRYDMSSLVSDRIIALTLGVMLLLTSLSLFFRQRFLTHVEAPLEKLTALQASQLTVATGVLLGVLVTISSVGAGALGVTALLVLYPRLPMATIVGSDIAHAVPLTLVAGIGHWWLGAVDWPLLGPLLTGSLPGIVLGSYLASRIPEVVLRPILAMTMVVVGGRLVY